MGCHFLLHGSTEGLKGLRSWSISIFESFLLFLSLASFSDSICWYDDCISAFQFHVWVERELFFLSSVQENVSLGLAWISSFVQTGTNSAARGCTDPTLLGALGFRRARFLGLVVVWEGCLEEEHLSWVQRDWAVG